MVGVAGRSKGCATCRKRRIKCDETRPVCKRCVRSRLQCDGYENFPIFIDRGQTGYRKRAPLEEVKPCPPPQRIFSPEAESTRLISWFREAHIRSHPTQHALQTQVHWLGLVGARRPPHPALKAALLATSFAKWNHVECNPGLRQNGRRHYQQSLDLTQKALLHREDALSDDILATACVMTLYELFDPSCQRTDSWLDHVTGSGNLLCVRGPRDFASAESRAMFEHMRHLFMIRCLSTRTTCVFASPQWRQLPWGGVPKSVEQQIIDQGLRLTSLWRDCDSRSTDERGPAERDVLLFACIEIFGTLNPLVAQTRSGTAQSNACGAAKTGLLLLSITALGIQLGAAASARKLLTTSDNVAVSGSNTTHLDSTTEMIAKARSLCEARRYLAQCILWSVEERMKVQAGALGTFSILWALQLAQEQFTLVDPEAEQCKAILTLLSQCTSPFDALGLPLGKYASSPVYRSF